MTDSRLDEAFRALRAETTGRSKQADETLVRVLASTRAKTQKRRRAWRYFVPLAAVLVASSAWAGASGRFTALFESASSKPHEAERIGLVDPATKALPITSSVAGPVEAVQSATTDTAPPVAHDSLPEAVAPSAVEPRVAPPVSSAAPSVAAASSPSPSPRASSPSASSSAASSPADNTLAEDKADFETAYRVHASGAPASAVKAWDTYLAAHPKGRFVPEARYARAVSLVHSGQTAAAREALRAFAEQAPGSYRQGDAARLLEGLGP